MNRLEQIVCAGLVEAFHSDFGGEWLDELDGEEISISTEKDGEKGGHGFVSVHHFGEDDPLDEDAEGVTKKYALKVTVELTEIP